MTARPSFVHGASDVPLRYLTVGALLDETVERHGGREALVVPYQQVRWTYRELAGRVGRFAAGLYRLGIRPGDRVGIWSPNNAEWVVTQLATARLGAILVNINPAYRLAELDFVLNNVGCRALVLANEFKGSDYISMTRELAPELRSCIPGALKSRRLPTLEQVIHLGTDALPGFLRFSDVDRLGDPADRDEIAALGARLQPDDPINIQFTSGTTGLPKGATLTHCNIVNNGYFVAEGMSFTEQDRLCIPVPLYHCFGMVLGVLGCVSHGATMVFPGAAFEAGAVLAAVQAERCTALYGVPTMFIAELEHPDFAHTDFSSLRTGVMAGAPCPVEVMRRVINEMNMRQVTIAYGMTETSPVSFQSGPDDTLERRVGTVGRVHPHVQVKIVDTAGRVVPRGQQGELLTRGYSVMKGYWGDPEKTRACIDADGWMHSGDLATLDDEGYCNIVGRLKDMIIRGGENIFPAEIEDYLFRHPKIQDAQVFGVPHERLGEAVCAWIRLKPGQSCTEDEVLAFCRGQIAHYKIPLYIRFVDDYPMTVTGKVQKFVMREMMEAELGLRAARTA